MAAPTAPVSQQAARVQWIYLISGILCTLFGAFMLSIQIKDLVNDENPDIAAYFLVALTGGYLIGWGLFQLVGALAAPRGTSRLYAVGGALAMIAGFLALVWPDLTVFILVLFVGWALIIWGVIDVMAGIATRGTPFWSLYMSRGVLSILVGLFALHRDELTIQILVLIVAVMAILWGIGDLMAAYAVHGLRSDWMAMGKKPAASRPAAAPRRPAAKKTTRKPAKRR